MKRTAHLPNGNRLEVVATMESGYFSVTATEYERGRDVCGGCMHAEVLEALPWLAPIVSLHLSDARTGEPLSAEANGFYWLAGALGGLGQEFHGSNDGRHTVAECERILAQGLRVSLVEARGLIVAVHAVALDKGNKAARAVFRSWVDAQAPRWAEEARQGRELLASKAAQYAAAGGQQ